MNKNINKSKLYMIICICVLCISVLGSTVAYYRKVLFNMNASTITYGLDYYINYAKGQDITSAELGLVENYASGASSDIELWKKDNTYNIYGHIYLDINEIGTNLSNSSALKYTIVNNGHIMSSGTLKGSSSGESVLALANIPLQTTKQLYTVYIWLDSNEDPDTSIEGETVSLTVRCEATMKSIDASVNLLNHINNLYIANYDSGKDISFADGTGMNYYAPSVSLMNDGLDSTGNMTNDPYSGNIRYYGSTPDNYIYFNCSDYSNPSASTCEVWRIIGIVDGKVKIIREESIGNLAWDYDKNQGATTNTYSNNWETSSLQLMLNSSYYNGNTSGTITYYNSSWSSTSLDMNAIGLKNDTTREMISESIWYLGGYSSANIYSNQMYKYERTNSVGTTIYSGNPFTITAKAGLISASDYGYATDLSKCNNKLSLYYNCTNFNRANWLFNSTEQRWLINVRSSYSTDVCVVSGSSVSCGYGTTNYLSVHPVLYLEPKLAIAGGEGTSDNPYQIYVEPPILIEHITNLYTNADKTQVTNNGIQYNYASSVRLMNDRLGDSEVDADGGNIRYYGADDENIKNYIYFNCSDYNNQSSSTCETWRIIGIIDGKVKIIKNESIGDYAWDSNFNINWGTATLNTYLNGDYYNSLSKVTQGLISQSTYYLGGYGTAQIYSNQIYKYERTNEVGTTIAMNGYPFTVETNIGIMYASDYGYATDFNKCGSNLKSYNSDECYSNDWLFNNDCQWLISVKADDPGYCAAWVVYPSGLVYAEGSGSGETIIENSARPVLYLNSALNIISSTDGSSGNPYQLIIP